MWRIDGRSDLLALADAARRVAREVVAPAVAAGVGSTHLWTPEKARVLRALDDAGLTSIVSGAGGDLAMRLGVVLWELASVDAGAAVCSMSGSLAQMVVRDIGTPEQRARYVDHPAIRHGALCLTEPLPGAGSDAASLEGRVGVTEWKPGEEPLLAVEKRGRFISHMDFAEFVVAAVDSRGLTDDKNRSSVPPCLVVLEPGDAGVFDRGAPVKKLGHQLSSTTNPEFRVTVPASRILGGYEIEGASIVPRVGHGEGLGPAFRRARVLIALVSAAKGLAELRDVDSWAVAEGAVSLGFAAARLSDEVDRGMGGQAAVICPAAKLFATEMAGSELEAVYLGPAAIQRRQISAFLIEEGFLAEFGEWTREMHERARTVGAAMELWRWTLDRLREGGVYREARQSVTFPMADALCWLLAARALALEAGMHAQAPRLALLAILGVHAGGQVAKICGGLVFGNGLGDGFSVLRDRLEATFLGVMSARQQATEFIQLPEVTA